MEIMRFNWAGSFLTIFTCVSLSSSAIAGSSSALEIGLYTGLTITNPEGTTCTIEYSDDLSQTNNWAVLTNFVLPSSPYLFIDKTAAATANRRFYRLCSPEMANPDPEKLVLINPGVFLMGEAPNAIQTTITNAFFIGKHVVTQAEYLDVMNMNPAENNAGGSYPMESVSWSSAVSYCNTLTQRETAAGHLPQGWVYRLPTEAEWEYACRAGTTTRFSFGEDSEHVLIFNYAWYAMNSQMTTHPVQTRLPNPWGLFDMHGNVRQWCQNISSSNPMARVCRGSGFDWDSSLCTSAARTEEFASSRVNNLGFRVVAGPALP